MSGVPDFGTPDLSGRTVVAARFLRHKDGGATLMKYYARYLNVKAVRISLPGC